MHAFALLYESDICLVLICACVIHDINSAKANQLECKVLFKYLKLLLQGRILYACTAEEVENACKSFLQQNVKLVGWDLEWRTTFRSGEPPRKTALMQLCYTLAGKHICLLLHIFHSGITPSVEAFLSTPVNFFSTKQPIMLSN